MFFSGLKNHNSGLTLLNHRQANLTGFTLLETIFAVAIILIAMIAVFGLVNFGISSISASKNKLIAAELAQEGQEIVRWWRESINPIKWDPWYNPASVKTGYFRAEIDLADPTADPDIEDCKTGGGQPCQGWFEDSFNPPAFTSIEEIPSFFQLRYDQPGIGSFNTGLYNHSREDDFINLFRIIHLSEPEDTDSDDDDDKRVVTVQVFWQEGSRLRSVKLVNHLYNWW